MSANEIYGLIAGLVICWPIIVMFANLLAAACIALYMLGRGAWRLIRGAA